MSAKIGLEIHIQLNTLKNKLFCSCPISYDSKPNTKICEICTGQPGSMPKLNFMAITKVSNLAYYLNMEISKSICFDRKHYIYPDLPKGYQITQYRKVLAKNGKLDIRDQYKLIKKVIDITQIKIQQDPAKISGNLIDYNRSGIPLFELVTSPDLNSEYQVKCVIKQILSICQELEICNTNLSTSFRADVNISIPGSERVELKNLGSLNDIISAIRYQIKRLESQGNKSIHTRNYIKGLNKTLFSRSKETKLEYGFLPELDLPEIKWNPKLTKIETRFERFDKINKLYPNFNVKYIWNLVYNKNIYDSYIQNKKLTKNYCQIISKIIKQYNYRGIKKSQKLQEVFPSLYKKGLTTKELEFQIRNILDGKELKSKNISLSKILKDLILEPKFKSALSKYKSGQNKPLNYIIGQILNINPKLTYKEIIKTLNADNNNSEI
jgi:aspartyl-tRNA(Asn)/glutamyl-tRNA(Gln) amidotransferase subunit B